LANDRLSELEDQLRRGAVSLGPRRFVTELAHPFAVSVGLSWADGRLSVRHEHLATECLITQLRLMLANYQDLDGRPRVVLATLPGEAHTLPLQLIALYLVTAGAKPRLLGGSTPVREIAECARVLTADVVGIAVTIDQDHARLARDLKTLRRGLEARVPIWLGGAGAVNHGQAGALVLTTWDEIDHAVASWRTSSKTWGHPAHSPAGD
jgi:methanogenic corrinoid protein MtbC1